MTAERALYLRIPVSAFTAESRADAWSNRREGGRQYDYEIYAYTVDWICRNFAVLFFLPVQEQPQPVPCTVPILFYLYSSPDTSGCHDRRGELYHQYLPFSVPGRKVEVCQRLGDVYWNLCPSVSSPCFYVVGMDIHFADCCKYCVDNCRIFT